MRDMIEIYTFNAGDSSVFMDTWRLAFYEPERFKLFDNITEYVWHWRRENRLRNGLSVDFLIEHNDDAIVFNVWLDDFVEVYSGGWLYLTDLRDRAMVNLWSVAHYFPELISDDINGNILRIGADIIIDHGNETIILNQWFTQNNFWSISIYTNSLEFLQTMLTLGMIVI